MATQILPVASTVASSADITFTKDTMVWVSGSRALDVSFGINAKGSGGAYDEVGVLGGGVCMAHAARAFRAGSE